MRRLRPEGRRPGDALSPLRGDTSMLTDPRRPSIVSAIVVQAEADLGGLARQINAAHADARAATRTSLEYAKRAGKLLLQAKARLPHGKFLEWVQANCTFKRSTANV